MEEKPVLRGDEFDVMTVFNVLDHLKMVDGYQLAFVYEYDGLGGHPVLYACPEGTAPFLSLVEFASAWPECLDRAQNLPQCDVLTYIETDGSQLGYLQLVLFDAMSTQFYLYWHASYRDRRFIATQAALDATVEKISDPLIPLTRAQVRQAQRIDLTPRVVVGEETVEIRAIGFTKWGGFFQTDYVLSKDHPNLILESKRENLIEYDCGIMF